MRVISAYPRMRFRPWYLTRKRRLDFVIVESGDESTETTSIELHHVGVLEHDEFTGGTFDGHVEDRPREIVLARNFHEIAGVVANDIERTVRGA